MNGNTTQRRSPEEVELERKRADLAALEEELAESELILATLANELRLFEARYLRTVGTLYAELDAIEAQIAEAEARAWPFNDELRRRATDARRLADESSAAVATTSQVAEEQAFKPADDLKRLYRDAARKLHPDLANDEVSRQRRTIMMAKANVAYACGDEATLVALLEEWESSPESVEGDGVAAELVRTIRKIHQVQRRLATITDEHRTLPASPIFQLFTRVRDSNAQGHDLLSEMRKQLKRDIRSARTRLGQLNAREARV